MLEGDLDGFEAEKLRLGVDVDALSLGPPPLGNQLEAVGAQLQVLKPRLTVLRVAVAGALVLWLVQAKVPEESESEK